MGIPFIPIEFNHLLPISGLVMALHRDAVMPRKQPTMTTVPNSYVDDQTNYASKVDVAFSAFASDNSAMTSLLKQLRAFSESMGAEGRATLTALEARVAAQGAQLMAFSAVPTPKAPLLSEHV